MLHRHEHLRHYHPKHDRDAVQERVCAGDTRRNLRRLADNVRGRHETMMGSINDPVDGKSVASTLFASVLVYAVCESSGGRMDEADDDGVIGVLGVLFRTGVVEFEAEGGAVGVECGGRGRGSMEWSVLSAFLYTSGGFVMHMYGTVNDERRGMKGTCVSAICARIL